MEIVSVIIPTFNTGDYLNRCLNSVTLQTYKNLEIIVVDDGSAEETHKICDEWAKKDKRIKIIHKQNGGVSSARNIGLDKCTGKYVMFIDADDYIDNSMIEKMLNKIEGYDCVYCKYILKCKNSNIYINEFNIKNLNNADRLKYFIGNKSKLKNNMLYKNSIMGSNWRILFRKDLTKNIRFDENLKYSEDFVFIMEILQKQPQINYLDEYLYYYCENEISYSSSINMKKIDYSYQILPYMYKYFDKNLYYKELAYFEISTILNFYSILKSNNLNLNSLDDEKKLFVNKNLTFKKIRNFCKFESNFKLKLLVYLIKLKIKK